MFVPIHGPQGELLLVESRYSEDQPREDNGRFGSGGTSASAKESFHGTAVHRAKEILKNGLMSSAYMEQNGKSAGDREYDVKGVWSTKSKDEAARYGQNAGADDKKYDPDHFALVVLKTGALKGEVSFIPPSKIDRIEIYDRTAAKGAFVGYPHGTPAGYGKTKPGVSIKGIAIQSRS